MLKLRRGLVVSERPLEVLVGRERRPAWVDESLHGPARIGDQVVVNVEARDLGLGSGGFDVLHVNLTRGLQGRGTDTEHVMKLNYTSLQHPVAPVEGSVDETQQASPIPVLVLPLHGHLAPAAFAFAAERAGARLGYVQHVGGALPGGISRDVASLRERGLICEHLTAGPSYGGEGEAISLVGALDAAAQRLGWDAAVVGPGPGILGSATRLGHGGIAALEAAHAALALGFSTVLSPRLSEADPRPRHLGLSHHTATVLELLLRPVEVALPSGYPGLEDEIAAAGRHRPSRWEFDLDAYAASGLPRRTMGRDMDEDALFFAAPLAAGAALAAR